VHRRSINRCWFGCGLRTASEHNTTCEDGGLSAIVRSYLTPGRIDKDMSLAGSFTVRLLVLAVAALGRTQRGTGGTNVGGRKGEGRGEGVRRM